MQRQDAGAAPTTLSALRSELARVRARGYAWEEDSVTPGFASVGCSVLDHNDLPTASIADTWNTGPSHPSGRHHEVDPGGFAAARRARAEALSRHLRG